MASRRYRNFATVVYPDSAPDGWVTIDYMWLKSFIVPNG